MWKPLDPEGWRISKRTDLDGAREPVSRIIERVRAHGDRALRELTLELDGFELESIRIPEEEFESAYDSVDPGLVEDLNEAYGRIHRFHMMQKPPGAWYAKVGSGIVLGMKTEPLDRIGAYIPGGLASYPSTALMATIPPSVAGVPSICCCSPPPIDPMSLVALDIAGVREVYTLGGAQAVAAMALGTESVERVQKIVGPGNVYVNAAKIMLMDIVDIDFPAGPSEIVVVADNTADPEFIASDILAQAEHDPMASCALLTTDPEMPERVWREIESRIGSAPRKEIIESALENSGYLILESLEDAVDVSNRLAPEHLSIQVEDSWKAVNMVRNAGAIFVGKYSAVASGDYASGTNHILPTAGYPRIYSGLDVSHFMKRISVQMVSREGLEQIGPLVESLAGSEGLHEHARSVEIRKKGRSGSQKVE